MVGAMLIVLAIGSMWAVFFNRGDDSTSAAADTAQSESNSTTNASDPEDGEEAPAADSGSEDVGDEVSADTVAGSENAGVDSAVTSSLVLPEDPLLGIELEVVTEDLQQPTILVTPTGESRMFVTERLGRIRVIDQGRLAETSWLNLTDRVLANGIEQGLLGLAFHPDYATNGRLFVYYTNRDGRRTLSEFWGGPEAGDPNSEKVLFSLPPTAGLE